MGLRTLDYYSLVAGLLLFSLRAIAAAQTALSFGELTSQPALPNLASNGSFEDLTPEGRPTGWQWHAQQCDATLDVVREGDHPGHRPEQVEGLVGGARDGQVCLRFRRTTPYRDHCYGTLFAEPIPVQPGRTYTVQCFVKSLSARSCWIGGGEGWRFRIPLPEDAPDWTLVSGSYTPGADETTFILRVNVDAPTQDLLIDGVAFLEGEWDWSPLDMAADAVKLPPVVPLHVFPAPLELPVLLRTKAPRRTTFTATVRNEQGHLAAEAERTADLTAGFHRLPLVWTTEEENIGGRFTVAVQVRGEGVDIGADESTVEVTTAGFLRERLAQAQARFDQLTQALDAAERAGRDVRYPRVAHQVAAWQLPATEQDLAAEAYLWADATLTELHAVLDQALAEVERAGPPTEEGFGLPVGADPIEIRDGVFTVRGRPIYFNGANGYGLLEQDCVHYPRLGFNVFECAHIGPNGVFPTPDEQVSRALIDNTLAVLDRAQAAGIKLSFLYALHYFPQWAIDQDATVGQCRDGFIQHCLEHPTARRLMENSLREIVTAIRGHPALHSLCLANEPMYNGRCAESLRQFRAWLPSQYADVAELNAAYGKEFASFDDVPLPAIDGTPAERYDWMRFNQERFAGFFEWLAGIVRGIAPDLPLHVKIMATAFMRDFTIQHGIDPERFCLLSDLNGCDGWCYPGEGLTQGWETQTLFYDLLRSFCPEKPIYNSENHLIIDDYGLRVPPQHIRTALWQGAIHGQGASAYWVWARDLTGSCGKSLTIRPACLNAAGRTALDLNRLAPAVAALSRHQPRVGFLYSIHAVANSPDHLNWLSRHYARTLCFGLPQGFVTDRMLAEGQGGNFELIVVAGARCGKIETWQRLEDYARQGGALLIVGEAFVRDERERTVPFTPLQHALEETRQEENQMLLSVDWPEGRVFYLNPEINDEALVQAYQTLFDLLGLEPLVSVTLADGAPPVGIEPRSARDGDRVLLNLLNYTGEPATVVIQPPAGARAGRDLLTDEPVGETVRLEPLEPRLIAWKATVP